MQKSAVPSKLLFSFAACLLATTALAGATPTVDPYVCHKAKDLKTSAVIATTPTSTGTATFVAGNTCELGKMKSICMPAYVNLSPVPAYPFVAQCCFKAKCTADETPVALAVNDIVNGEPTFNGEVETGKKVSTVCLPCDYMTAP
jgi:hypothetical protein